MTTPFGPMVLICHAKAGRGKLLNQVLPPVEAELKRRELTYEIKLTESAGHASELAREAVRAGIRLVVAVGGDGTVHEVVNGMIEGDAALDPESALGVIPGGTGCDFIKTFGIPPGPVDAVRHLDGPESFPIDIGKITFDATGETRYFANIAEVGLGASTVARAKSLPRWLGPTVYFFAFWLAMRKHRAADVVVDLVDRKYEGKMNNLVVANGQFFGGGMKVAPRAAPTDGVLDIQIEHARKRDAIALMPKVFKGEHVPHPDILEVKRVRLSVTSDRDLLVEADGEVLGKTPVTFELLRDALRFKV